MEFLEALTWVGILLLSLYGCANVMRRLVLAATKCDRSVTFLRLAIPPRDMAVEPLSRCLQAQASWRGECSQTILLLPDDSPEQARVVARLLECDKTVVPMTGREMISFVSTLFVD